MKKFSNLCKVSAALLAMLVLIFDAKTALIGAKDGLDLCVDSVIPSLFPFIVLSFIINTPVTGRYIKAILHSIGNLCGVPDGAESLLLIGLLGGYPVGAQSINEAYRNGTISKTAGRRLLGFCNNAGPAFIFGIAGGLFADKTAVWLLWFIHILSAFIVGIILPDRQREKTNLQSSKTMDFPLALKKSIRVLAVICGWVVLFRILLAFCQRWFLWIFPAPFQAAFAGLLELTNGCHFLYTIESQGLRYILTACFLSFGGICVAMQTVSVTKDVGIGFYFPGKVLQCAITFVFAYAVQYLLFSDLDRCTIPVLIPVIVISVFPLIPLLLRHGKKVVAIHGKMLYNGGKI